MAKRVFQMRDKHLSTTNLYPKQIKQSLPVGIVPVVPEPETYVPTGEEPETEYITINNVTYKVGGGGETDFPLIQLDGSQITYNPTQYHFTEEQFNIIVNNSLLYIQIGSYGEKYLYNVTGGTLSPLSLTRVRRDSDTSIFIYGIVVDLTTKIGTYYKGNMQRRLYQHNIHIQQLSNVNYPVWCCINIILDNDTQLDTPSKFIEYLKTLNKTVNVNTGIYKSNTIITYIESVEYYLQSDTGKVKFNCRADDGSTFTVSHSTFLIQDTIIAL